MACQKHFLPRVGKNLVCDVLAGEQGPSCSMVEQIPDLKLVHVRFIKFPKSLSVSDMMRLRKVIKKTVNVAIEMRSFHIDGLGWSANPITAEFVIEKQPFGEGGFQQAYRYHSYVLQAPIF